MSRLVVIRQQIKEKRRGGGRMCPPAYIITKYPSLNRVKHLNILNLKKYTYVNLIWAF